MHNQWDLQINNSNVLRGIIPKYHSIDKETEDYSGAIKYYFITPN